MHAWMCVIGIHLSPHLLTILSTLFSSSLLPLGLTALGLLLSSEPNGKEISWQEFVTQVLESGEVERIIVTNRNVAKVRFCLDFFPPSLPPSLPPSFSLLSTYRGFSCSCLIESFLLPSLLSSFLPLMLPPFHSLLFPPPCANICTHPHFLPSPPSLPSSFPCR